MRMLLVTAVLFLTAATANGQTAGGNAFGVLVVTPHVLGAMTP